MRRVTLRDRLEADYGPSKALSIEEFFRRQGLGLLPDLDAPPTPDPVPADVHCPTCITGLMEVHTKVVTGRADTDAVTVTPYVGACTSCEFIHVFTLRRS